MTYNATVLIWPEITRLVYEEAKYPTEPAHADLL